MDSLLANYASSSEEEDEEQQQQKQHSREDSSHNPTSPSADPIEETPKISQTFLSLPKPKSSLLFSTVPQPKYNPKIPTTSHFNPKRIVQFKPPLNPSLLNPLDDDDDEEEEQKRTPSTQTSSAVKSLSSFLPAPKNSLGLGSGAAALGGGRRSIVEANAPDEIQLEKNESGNGEELGHHEGNWVDESISTTTSEGLINESDSSNWVTSNENYGSYGGYYGSYDGNYGYYSDGSTPVTVAPPDTSSSGAGVVESVPRIPGKRGRDEIPVDIVEVKQDELMKNRPREDQVKLTGIAFGPAYQPVSTKGKPSKLHKRKHQIGSLYFDMRQKEMELSERRSKGLLTKAETQAKYGW